MIEQMFGFEGSLFATNLILFPPFLPSGQNNFNIRSLGIKN